MENKSKIHGLFFGVVIMAAIAIPFTWNETFDLDKKINDQKLTNYFLTVLTLTGTAYTIYFLAKQVEDAKGALKPEIFIENLIFGVSDRTLPDKTLLPYFSTRPESNEQPRLIATNVGNGIAIGLEFQWIYSVPNVQHAISKVYTAGLYTSEHFDSNEAGDPPEKIDFLKSNTQSTFSLPYHYLHLYGETMFHEYRRKGLFYPEVDAPIALHVKYMDIRRNRYEKRFKVNVFGTGMTIVMDFLSEHY